MNRRKEELVDQFLRLAQRIVDRLSMGSVEAWEGLEVTKPQLKTVLFLRESPRRMGDIAAHLGTTLSAATSLIDRLVAKGLVERFQDPEDRRVVMCRVSALGGENVERLYGAGRSQVAEAAKDLSIRELEAVVEGIGLLASAMERRASRAKTATMPSPVPKSR